MRKMMERRLRHEERLLIPAPQPELEGLSPAALVLWRARNGNFEKDVEQANDGRAIECVESDNDPVQAAPGPPCEEEVAAEAANPLPDGEAVSSPEISPQEAYINEHCRWRLRTKPEDYCWGDDEDDVYDPLADA
jgi:hypothetical protein